MAGRAQREVIQGHLPFDRHGDIKPKGKRAELRAELTLRCPNQTPAITPNCDTCSQGLSLTPHRTLLKASPI